MPCQSLFCQGIPVEVLRSTPLQPADILHHTQRPAYPPPFSASGWTILPIFYFSWKACHQGSAFYPRPSLERFLLDLASTTGSRRIIVLLAVRSRELTDAGRIYSVLLLHPLGCFSCSGLAFVGFGHVSLKCCFEDAFHCTLFHA